jgi:putative Ca2+/H+ antiporter (TMEM165/GDT1 family)
MEGALFAIFLATFAAVFAAEIAGDKLIYTTGVLVTRYRALPILIGISAAFIAKMGCAVLVGKAISNLPPLLLAAVTTINFLAIACALWRRTGREESSRESRPSRTVMLSFAAIFFSEWGDAGQITAATLAARFGAPALVWLGAVAAMATKGVIAASMGAAARQWVEKHLPPKTIRYAAAGLLLLLGALSAAETLTERHRILQSQ